MSDLENLIKEKTEKQQEEENAENGVSALENTPVDSEISVSFDDEDGITELMESTDELIEEIIEEINVLDFSGKEDESENETETPAEVRVRRIPATLVLNITAVVLSVAALIFSIVKTDLKIGQGELFVESGVVNEMLGNLIRKDLSRKIPENIEIQGVNIQVVLYGKDTDNYMEVSDIGDGDKVTAEIMFFPQNSVKEFAEDCRAVLDAMKEQEVTYDEIAFTAKDNFTNINATLSGRFSMDISVEKIAKITYFLGEIEAGDDIEDVGDIE